MVASALPQTVPECHAVITQLLERVKLLEERVNLDSNNSSKPPSSNGPVQASPIANSAVPAHADATCSPGTRATAARWSMRVRWTRWWTASPSRFASVVVKLNWQTSRSATRYSMCRRCALRSMNIACTADAVRVAARPMRVRCRSAFPRGSWGRARWPWSACWARVTTSAKASQPIIKYLGEHGLKLYFLPPYSPEPNRIERLWHKMKYTWMAVKCRNSVDLEADVDYIISDFRTTYKFNF
jgi:hypothetical protein